MSLTITLPQPINIQIGETVSVSEIKINHVMDEYARKRVVVYFENGLPPRVLWEGDAYDAIGQWTDSDVEARILELFGS